MTQQEAERALLGALLSDPRQLAALEDPEPLLGYSGRLILSAIRTCISNGGAEPSQVRDYLARAGQLTAIGGPGRLVALYRECEWAGGAAFYRRELDAATVMSRRSERLRYLVDSVNANEPGSRIEEHAEALLELYQRPTAGPEQIATLSAADALLDPRPIPWLLRGWLAECDRVILAAEGGSGKSLLALDVALALVSGQGVLGLQPERSRRVVYVDAENNEQVIRQRARSMIAGRGLTDSAQSLGLWFCVHPRLSDASQQRDLLATLTAQHGADTLILDSLVRFWAASGCPENDNSAVATWFATVLDPLRKARPDLSVLCLHHLSKPSKERTDVAHRIRGAGDVRNWADAVWALEGDRSGRTRVLKREKSRWGEQAAAVRMEYVADLDGTHAELTYDTGSRDARQIIQDAMSDAGGEPMSKTNLVDILIAEGFTRGSALRVFTRVTREMEHAGLIDKEQRGKCVRVRATKGLLDDENESSNSSNIGTTSE